MCHLTFTADKCQGSLVNRMNQVVLYGILQKDLHELSSNSCNNSENMAACDYRIKQEKPANGLQEKNASCTKSDDVLETASTAQSTFQQKNADLDSSCSSQALARETSWKIKINDQKKKLMENILLYEEDKLNSSELFES